MEFNCLIGTLISLLLFTSPILGSIGLVTGEVTDQVIVTGVQTSNPDLFYSKGNYTLTYFQKTPSSTVGMIFSFKSLQSTDLQSWSKIEVTQYLMNPVTSVVEMNGTIHFIYNNQLGICDLILSPDGSEKIIQVRERRYNFFRPDLEEFLSPTAGINNGTIYLLYIYDHEWGDFVHRIDKHIERIESPDGLTWKNITKGAFLSGDSSLNNDIDFFIKDNDFIYAITNGTNWTGKTYGYFLKNFNGSDAKRIVNKTTNSISIIMASNSNYYIIDDHGLLVSSDDGNTWTRAITHNFSQPSMIQDDKGNVIIAYENSGEIRKWEYSPLMVNITFNSKGRAFYTGSSSKIKSRILDKNYSIEDYEWISSKDGVVSRGNTSELDVNKLTMGTHKIRLRVLDNMQVWSESNELTITIGKSTDNKSTCFELVSIIIFGAIIVTFAFKKSWKRHIKIIKKKRKSKKT